MPAIDIENVSFSYGTGEEAPVLDRFNLRIEEGECLCVVGPSGCGKTTLLRLIAGLQFPTSGRIRIGGNEVTGPQKDASIVFQDYALFPWMTAKRNVRFGLKAARPSLTKQQISELADVYLAKVSMLDDADKHPYQMSGGMRQRVAIARALAMDTPVLLLDEPFGALDAKIRTDLQNLLEELWLESGRGRNGEAIPKKTVIFVTHDITEAVRMADRVLLMQPGEKAYDVRVDAERPRLGLPDSEVFKMKRLRRELTERLADSAGSKGRSCRCGGPA